MHADRCKHGPALRNLVVRLGGVQLGVHLMQPSCVASVQIEAARYVSLSCIDRGFAQCCYFSHRLYYCAICQLQHLSMVSQKVRDCIVEAGALPLIANLGQRFIDSKDITKQRVCASALHSLCWSAATADKLA